MKRYFNCAGAWNDADWFPEAYGFDRDIRLVYRGDLPDKAMRDAIANARPDLVDGEAYAAEIRRVILERTPVGFTGVVVLDLETLATLHEEVVNSHWISKVDFWTTPFEDAGLSREQARAAAEVTYTSLVVPLFLTFIHILSELRPAAVPGIYGQGPVFGMNVGVTDNHRRVNNAMHWLWRMFGDRRGFICPTLYLVKEPDWTVPINGAGETIVQSALEESRRVASVCLMENDGVGPAIMPFTSVGYYGRSKLTDLIVTEDQWVRYQAQIASAIGVARLCQWYSIDHKADEQPETYVTSEGYYGLLDRMPRLDDNGHIAPVVGQAEEGGAS